MTGRGISQEETRNLKGCDEGYSTDRKPNASAGCVYPQIDPEIRKL